MAESDHGYGLRTEPGFILRAKQSRCQFSFGCPTVRCKARVILFHESLAPTGSPAGPSGCTAVATSILTTSHLVLVGTRNRCGPFLPGGRNHGVCCEKHGIRFWPGTRNSGSGIRSSLAGWPRWSGRSKAGSGLNNEARGEFPPARRPTDRAC